MLRTGLAVSAAMAAMIGSACGSSTGPSEGGDARAVYIEVHVTGGFASVDYTYAVDGSAGEARGIACVRMCDFEPGEQLARLSAAQILRLSDMLKRAGVLELDGTDFGDQCCDQFHYSLLYRVADRISTVRGSSEALPVRIKEAVMRLDRLLRGIVPIIVAFDSRSGDWPSDRLTLRHHSLEGSVLTLEVEYGGGCFEHEFDLVAWNGWLESFPVQAGVLLAHESYDDPCRALIIKELRFDLTPLKEDYVAGYGAGEPGGTTIVLRLTVPDGRDPRTIEYRF